MKSPFFTLLVWNGAEKFLIDERQEENDFIPHSLPMFDCEQISYKSLSVGGVSQGWR